MRIISLSPAATEIVSALGALDRLVGISHRCDYPPAVASRPRVTRPGDTEGDRDGPTGRGDTPIALLADEIVRAQPDLIILDDGPHAAAVDRIGSTLRPTRILRLDARSVDDVLANIERIAGALGAVDRGRDLVLAIQEELATVHQTLKAAGPPRPPVAVLERLDPVTAAGRWVPDLIRRAGGANSLASTSENSGLTASDITTSGAEVVVFSMRGLDARESADAATRLLAQSDWHAIRSLQLWAVDSRVLTSRGGPRLVDGVETLARILHPRLFSPLDSQNAVRLTPTPIGRTSTPVV